jgi:branched-chain amino acid transport system ATP-binding protein
LADIRQNLLKVHGLVTGYGNKRVLNGASLEVGDGEIVALIGHNGAGKSTLLKAAFGMLPLWNGSIEIDGVKSDSPSPRSLLRAGVAYVPQGNRVFSDLSVGENLQLGGITLPRRGMLKAGMDRAFDLFPILKQRMRQRAGTLSGGEKQMLAVANVIVLSPRLLFLDEPSLGLSPHLVTIALKRIQQISRDEGAAVLIVEQKVRQVLEIARRVYVLRNGQVSFTGWANELSDDAALRQVYL